MKLQSALLSEESVSSNFPLRRDKYALNKRAVNLDKPIFFKLDSFPLLKIFTRLSHK